MSVPAVAGTRSPRAAPVRRLLAVIRLGRPIFLLGGFALYGLGALTAVRRGHAFELGTFLVGQLAISAIQLMTHYANDYFDYEADKANRTPTRWSGGSRVLVNQELPRRVALQAALLVGALAPLAAIGLLLIAEPGRSPIGSVFLLVVIQFLAWSHAGPPLSLHSRGWGELTTVLVVPLLTPLAGFLIQAGRVEIFPVILSVPLCLLQFAMLLTIEFPDYSGDRTVGKRSLVVLLGPPRAAGLTAALIVAAFAVTFSTVGYGVPRNLAVGWLGLVPLATLQIWRFRRGDHHRPRAWETLCFGAVALFFLAIVVDLFALA